jgi:deazaflavin-dependent oxidoreductase (nitroreductase family)
MNAQETLVREAAEAHLNRHTRMIRSQRDGRVLSAVMLPFFLALPPKGFGVLTTIGRKSGKRRRKCLRVIRRAEKAYIVQLRPPHVALERPNVVTAWVWNIRANPQVTLRIQGTTFQGVARELTDPDELNDARQAICGTVNLFDYGECAVHLRGIPTRTKIKELHRYWFDTGIPLAVDLAA